VALAALSFASVAAADRPSADAEHAALAAAADEPAECVETWISEVDPTWAELFATNADDCAQADGVTLWHRNAGVWSRVYDGPFDEQPCPLDSAVPDVVARDFGLCFRPSGQAYAVVGVYLRARPRLLVQARTVRTAGCAGSTGASPERPGAASSTTSTATGRCARP
jgi:hypothetical protein